MCCENRAVTAELTEVLDAVVRALGGTPRAGQTEMAEAVGAALAESEHVLIQAGTGTGKSMAYLVPVLLHTTSTGERAVVSTATLALQRQIVGIDAPLASKVVRQETGKTPKVALLKGWHNYVCKHKVTGGFPEDSLFEMEGIGSEDAQDHDAPTSGLGAEILRLREFSEESETGDRDDLTQGVSDRAWRQVSVTKLECLGNRCPLIDECFPEAARQTAAAADVVITNHAMLGVVASGNASALPEHEVLIVDEAHELGSRVTSQATQELSAAAVERIARIVRRNAGMSTSSLDEAAEYLREALATTPPGRFTRGLPLEINAAVRDISEATRALLVSLREEAKSEASSTHLVRSELQLLQEISDRLLGDDVQGGQDVGWVESPRRPGEGPRIQIAPLDVARRIHAHLLADRAVVATSATLALGGKFDAMASALGFFDDYTARAVQSPFTYAKQGILYTPRHLPPPGRDGLSPETLAEIVALIAAAGGRTLGLFSSRRAAEHAAEHVREHLEHPVLLQGEDGLPALVRGFLADDRASLFGTLSLWQGIDVPGPACSLVIIDRIPFPRPDDPIMSARAEAADRRGGNGFMSVSATHAALLLAQGAGRLIRRVDDQGVVAILDSRVVTRRYGSFLRKSLPPFWQTNDSELVRGALQRLDAAHSAPRVRS